MDWRLLLSLFPSLLDYAFWEEQGHREDIVFLTSGKTEID